ncbi:uncharacterized protein LTR77_008308 [Saxophila tyrrhenica]|uniref:Methyltransferase domain-containing protein n=1 Tax=Saxophila tyrrhenica TaxID=1690608 RepID=A0AAV9P3H3_9PEZI|nr:hypothetical protein LTR77_008308 [Saxophila tyrrhenica]
MARNQPADAQALYDSRSDTYDDSHHPRLARHFVEMLQLEPASTMVGPSGRVMGVDVSTGMLDEANKKLSHHEPKNVSFHNHSMADLNSLDAIKDKQFDAIICCSALVLLEDAAAALKHWTKYLRRGGRLIVDVTHPVNLAAGTALERVGQQLGRPIMYHREPFQRPEDLSSRMHAAGLHNVEMTFLSIMDIPGTDALKDYIMPDFSQPKVQAVYDVEEADDVFETAVEGTAYTNLASPPEVRQRAKALFKEEWSKLADIDGKVRVVDGLFVGMGWK